MSDNMLYQERCLVCGTPIMRNAMSDTIPDLDGSAECRRYFLCTECNGDYMAVKWDEIPIQHFPTLIPLLEEIKELNEEYKERREIKAELEYEAESLKDLLGQYDADIEMLAGEIKDLGKEIDEMDSKYAQYEMYVGERRLNNEQKL